MVEGTTARGRCYSAVNPDARNIPRPETAGCLERERDKKVGLKLHTPKVGHPTLL